MFPFQIGKTRISHPSACCSLPADRVAAARDSPERVRPASGRRIAVGERSGAGETEETRTPTDQGGFFSRDLTFHASYVHTQYLFSSSAIAAVAKVAVAVLLFLFDVIVMLDEDDDEEASR